MIFNDYLNEAWEKHQDHAEEVFNEFPQFFSLCEKDDDVLSLGHLITHVCGEHLGRWKEGIALLESLLREKPIIDSSGINRFKAILNLCADKNYSLIGFSDSDQSRILASCASALLNVEIKRAGRYFKKADLIAKEKLDAKDPAIKGIAMTGNNLACALEEKENRNTEEDELMIFAARMGRTYWEKAGTWMHVERAEYRLAQTYLKANKPEVAKTHALNCLSIIEKNGDDPIELFFAHEVLCLCAEALNDQDSVEKHIHQMETCFARMNNDDQCWTRPTLDKIKAL